ncbi:MAG: hypothetical protein ACR2KN_01405, partial [Geodermatophilaceae bacterium]
MWSALGHQRTVRSAGGGAGPARRTPRAHLPRCKTGSDPIADGLEGGTMEFDVLVEIPKGQRNKYEVDHAS